MKILEVRDGFVKIESEKKIEISSFLELKGTAKKYIAQVIRSKNNGTGYNVYAKILFTYDGMLKKYDKTMPDSTAEVSEFPYDNVNNSFNYSNPIVAGKFVSDNSNILLDSSLYKSSTIISIDNPEMNDIVIQNLSKQARQAEKTVIIDMLGVINGDKYVAGRDFRLPLNSESLKFMYEDCLNDATSESKNLIKEIFTDLSEYSKEVKFLPFSTLKMIVDDMVEKSHIFKLLVLKNKLAKFDSAGYFASNISDAENLTKILKSDFAIIDLSKVDNLFQNRYLSVILSELENISPQSTVFIEASNAINKKNIKTLLYSEKINSTFVTHSKFKYLADIKPLFKNYVIDKSYTNKDVFSLYSFFIESMHSDNYLIVGECTNYVPLVSNLEKYDVEIKKLPQDAISEEVIETKYDSQVTEELQEIAGSSDAPSEIANEIPAQEEPETNTKHIENSSDDLEDIGSAEVGGEELIASIFNEEEGGETIETSEPEDTQDGIFPLNQENISLEQEPSEDIEQISSSEQMAEGLTEVLVEDNEISDEEQGTENTQQEEILIEEDDNDFEEQDTASDNELLSEEDNVEVPIELAKDFDEIERADSEGMEEGESSEDGIVQDLEPQIVPLENQDDELGEFEELNILDTSDISDDDILVDINDDIHISEGNENRFENEEDFVSTETIDRDIVEDVDKVFTTMKDDNISDSDLDLIDTLNDFENESSDLTQSEDGYFTQNDAETLQELDSEEDDEGFLEPLEEISDSQKEREPEKEILETRESSTPMVPIYEADIPEEDKVISDDIEQGDTVVHAKYGSGVVEKMIKYGSKNLYSINFDNVGRRLLDPTLTEIKKA